MSEEKFKALKEEMEKDQISLMFWQNDHPICPHCGYECDVNELEWWDLYRDDGLNESSKDCPSCNQEFKISIVVEYKFSTDEQDGFEP